MNNRDLLTTTNGTVTENWSPWEIGPGGAKFSWKFGPSMENWSP